MKLSPEERKIIRHLQSDLGVEASPFASLARRTGLAEKDFLRGALTLRRRGVIRRFGAILRHQKAGVHGNAMVVWKVREEEVPRVGGSCPLFRRSPIVTSGRLLRNGRIICIRCSTGRMKYTVAFWPEKSPRRRASGNIASSSRNASTKNQA